MIATRRRAATLEETWNGVRSTYEQRLCQATAREAEMLGIIQRQKADLVRLNNMTYIEPSSNMSVRDSVKQTSVTRHGVNGVRESSHLAGDSSKCDSIPERISSEDIMLGLSSLHVDY